MHIRLFLTTLLLVALTWPVFGASEVEPAPNGIRVPEGYQDWRLLSSSYREDNKTLRVILANDEAMEAALAGQTNPWPDGAILGKLVWREARHPQWQAAIIPGELSHIEFMIKDQEKFADTVGWGFARWVGDELKPYGEDQDFAKECVACHMPVKDQDYVFTKLSTLPR
ncbi:cytochrome P460 family protein [Geoalkalibacter halelectricus]|uniref:Cytochrome P460 family protein n=1 Tax=Geoalkalibacter halelectricus TaxID=2847045 RepID=A0ABY5ZP30_9BACT|nr:cytochrome P460 family protein [Geoalkalibacter halelectricus]MDO3379147.1 cytochrome P460 family protein [Geoalkalibacter halelectricus]UWZ80907.1 cytochrome P460 family protein [Geoalkalibacter halelectricus]